jgi:hypothetical protein
MTGMKHSIERQNGKISLVVLLVACGLLAVARPGDCETMGFKDAQGRFVPRVNVTVANKQIVIKKINPQEKFRPISLVLNAKNTRLIHNVGLLDIEWVDAAERTGKPMKLAGPKYNPATHTFQDSMDKSATLKIVDKTTKNLFAGKQLGDLLTIQIDGNPLVSAETAEEKDRTLQLGTGKDVSINVNKTSILFNENNVKSGDILDVDNRSGLDQVLGIELPEKGLYYRTIRRKPDQTKVPDGDWKRFTVPANSGILIAMVPDPEPAQLEQLDGKEITIKVYQGNRLRETRRVPIRISPELRLTSGELNPQGEPPEVSDRTGSVSGTNRAGESPESAAPVVQPATSPSQPGRPAKTAASNNLWLWVLVIGNMAVLVLVLVYGVSFVLPKIQVLEDRLAKNEMFIHGSREAIREELEQVKDEILKQCTGDAGSE